MEYKKPGGVPFSTKQVLHIKAPKVVENSVSNFTAFFSDLHKLIGAKKDLDDSDKAISFEVCLRENYFEYQIISSKKVSSLIAPLLYTKFKDAEIAQKDLTEHEETGNYFITEFKLKTSSYFPLKTEFEASDDPYMVMAAILSKLEHFSEKIVLQMILRPTSESWFKQFIREKFFFIMGTLNSIKVFFEKPFLEKDFINYYEEVKKKYGPKLFLANVRLMVNGPSKKDLEENISFMTKALGKLDNGDINSLEQIKVSESVLIPMFLNRQLSSRSIVLNAQEAAALFHFPDSNLNITNVDHVASKRIEPPKELPKGKFLESPQLSVFGVTNFRDSQLEFGIKRADRNRHMYVVGKTGMGKSKLIELLAISDIYSGKGLCVIDPHGDLATDILKYIPQERIKDVVYFNPADKEYPIGFNPLACYTTEAKDQVVTGFLGIFKKLFAHNWTNRLEHMLRFIVLALTEAGDATVVDIVKLLTNVEFRQKVVAKLENPVVKNFWTHEFAAWNEKFDNEAIIPIINQVGQFIANDYIRSVVGQKTSTFDFFEAMQQGKIIIINIAKGKLGEENTALLGSMIITKIQEATMARVNLPGDERKEFYLYVDEFQHFATEAFNQILSEARKFNLSLTIAHQYLDQLTESIRKTVFGNVGSFVSFRVGPEDGRFMAKEFTPHVAREDLINLDFRDIYAKISVDGKTSEPFSATTLDAPQSEHNFSDEIIAASQKQYGTPRKEVVDQFSKDRETMRQIAEEKEEIGQEEFEEPIV